MTPGNEGGPAAEATRPGTLAKCNFHANALHRRFLEASRGVLECGCADPWLCRCHDEPRPLNRRQIDAAFASADHLLAAGMCPPLSPEVARIGWRRGGETRRLVSEVAARNGIRSDSNPLPVREVGGPSW